MTKKIFIGTFIIVLVIALGAKGCLFYMDYKKTLARENNELVQKQQVVESYKNVAYGNQFFEDIPLEGKTKEEIVALLREQVEATKDNSISITVDNETYRYGVEEFGFKVSFVTSEGKTYNDIEKLAESIISRGKDASIQKQFDILHHDQENEYLKVAIATTYKENKVNKTTNTLYKLRYQKAQNASMNRKRKVVPGKKGRTLNSEKVASDIKNYLSTPKTEDFIGIYNSDKYEPEWTTKEIKQVNTVIGEFSTTFAASGNRGNNVAVGASRVNGQFLLPGDVISIDEILHDDSDGLHYLAAGSYVNGRTVDTIGGGICQVASTLYNAILRSGIIPIERINHMMAVAYVPLGLDATISENVCDLKIENTLDYPIYIEGITKGGTLTFKVYSKKDVNGDYTYQPRSQKLSALSANAYLDVYKKGKLVESIFMHRDNYAPHR